MIKLIQESKTQLSGMKDASYSKLCAKFGANIKETGRLKKKNKLVDS